MVTLPGVTAAASDGGWDNVLTNANFPGIAILATSGVIGMIFVVRWMIRFQREFTDFYIAENKNLRTEVSELKEELEGKNDIINELKDSAARCQRMCDDHEATITRLNRIIERRKLEREEE